MNLSLTFAGHRVRMVGTADRPEWVAKDVCRVLGLHNGRSTLHVVVPAEEKGVHNVDTPGGPQPHITVTEGGLYRLVSRSRKPTALRFQSWIFNDVLPCIRKHGCYPEPKTVTSIAGIDLRDHRQLLGVAVQALELLKEYQPKAEAFDALSEADGDVGLQEAGRILGFGPNIFVKTLLCDGILFRGEHGKPTPYERHTAAGRFRVVLTTPDPQGQTFSQTKVTPMGMTWLAKRYRTLSESLEM